MLLPPNCRFRYHNSHCKPQTLNVAGIVSSKFKPPIPELLYTSCKKFVDNVNAILVKFSRISPTVQMLSYLEVFPKSRQLSQNIILSYHSYPQKFNLSTRNFFTKIRPIIQQTPKFFYYVNPPTKIRLLPAPYRCHKKLPV